MNNLDTTQSTSSVTNHAIRVIDAVSVSENLPSKARPQCCEMAKEGPVWWEPQAKPQSPDFPHRAGWSAIYNLGQRGMYWLYNPNYCPCCGTKLPERP